MPCPPPMHAAARPYLFFLRFSSYKSVMTNRVPVAPSGWPSAMAPPFTLTLSRSSSSAFSTARYCAANASLTSTRSMSRQFHSRFVQRDLCRRNRTDSHNLRRHARNSPTDNPPKRLRLCSIRRGYNNSGAAIDNSAGIPGSHKSIFCESRLQLWPRPPGLCPDACGHLATNFSTGVTSSLKPAGIAMRQRRASDCAARTRPELRE